MYFTDMYLLIISNWN